MTKPTSRLSHRIGDTLYVVHDLGLGLWVLRANGTDIINPTTKDNAVAQFTAIVTA